MCAESGLRPRFLLQVYAAVNDEPHAFHRALYRSRRARCSSRLVAFAPSGASCPARIRSTPTSHRSSTNGLVRSRPSRAQQQRGTVASALAGRARGGGRWRGEPTPPRIARRADETRTFPEHELVVSAEEVEKTSGPRDPQATRLLAEFEAGGAGSGGAGTDAADASELRRIRPHWRGSAERWSSSRGLTSPRASLARPSSACATASSHTRGRSGRRAQRAPARVPPCERCGAARRFEFRVLPQALHFMGIDLVACRGARLGNDRRLLVRGQRCAPPPLPLADGTGTLADVAQGVVGDAARCAAIGLRVRLMDLNRRAELNGQSGLVVGWSAAAERWEVCLESGEKLRVRSVNLRPVDGSAASRSRGYVEEYVGAAAAGGPAARRGRPAAVESGRRAPALSRGVSAARVAEIIRSEER